MSRFVSASLVVLLGLGACLPALAQENRAPACTVTVLGRPISGHTITVVSSFAPAYAGFQAFVACSLDTGAAPDLLAGVPIVWPLADPVTLIDTFPVARPAIATSYGIPADPALIGQTLTFAVAIVNPLTGVGAVSQTSFSGPIIEDGIS
jgi:hypothetical protein